MPWNAPPNPSIPGQPGGSSKSSRSSAGVGRRIKHVVGQLQHIVYQQIRRLVDKRFRLKPVRYTASSHTGVARGPNVDIAVAHHDGALARRTAFAEQCFDADGIGLLLLEAVSSVNLEEVFRQTQ